MSKTGPVVVGLIGAGNISDAYLSNLVKFPDVEVRFIADLDLSRAAEKASTYDIAKSGSGSDLLADDEIELVINLTIPAAHVEVGVQALVAGKHVWSEKPYAIDRIGAEKLQATAEANNRKISVAPDTFLGAGIQTGLQTIRSGAIGKPISALALFQVDGPESWHPSAEFYYAKGGGPLLDMGPYYLTALVQIFGSAKKVTATASKSHESRTYGAGPNKGSKFPVEVNTQISALIEFESGASAIMILSFDSNLNRGGILEITGSEGVAILPDPNNFDGDTSLHLAGGEIKVIPAAGLTHGRGTGILDLAQSIRLNRKEQVPGSLAFHALDIMLSIEESAAASESVAIKSSFVAPDVLPINWDPRVKTLS